MRPKAAAGIRLITTSDAGISEACERLRSNPNSAPRRVESAASRGCDSIIACGPVLLEFPIDRAARRLYRPALSAHPQQPQVQPRSGASGRSNPVAIHVHFGFVHRAWPVRNVSRSPERAQHRASPLFSSSEENMSKSRVLRIPSQTSIRSRPHPPLLRALYPRCQFPSPSDAPPSALVEFELARSLSMARIGFSLAPTARPSIAFALLRSGYRLVSWPPVAIADPPRPIHPSLSRGRYILRHLRTPRSRSPRSSPPRTGRCEAPARRPPDSA